MNLECLFISVAHQFNEILSLKRSAIILTVVMSHVSNLKKALRPEGFQLHLCLLLSFVGVAKSKMSISCTLIVLGRFMDDWR